ncbi:hypothetical protein H6G80_34640 [Nostoc sp. FACHB-87]|uniref:hypothetical protein n=1 Tax=Nostocales TaxID=1161 RepID=UPI001682EE95|nr:MULTISPECIES: hypothetical protein [Nostocales]MBD2303703.1 hypothetical protein [Nostoc sp. FACHB-190]MBD2459171.1 hypothetical protein [Nostoc sp. FACHB-87]MBD2480151.1 hypothetical protein [Anabaena sp. FACHB-83]MBD2491815.1 hypothetical protein [Aulosira sp. FACHB-615]
MLRRSRYAIAKGLGFSSDILLTSSTQKMVRLNTQHKAKSINLSLKANKNTVAISPRFSILLYVYVNVQDIKLT